MSDISGMSSDNRIRFTGLASGMDTEGTIKKLMAAENVRVDKLKQNRQLVQWRQEAYRDIIKDLREMRSNYFLWDSPADTNLIKSDAYTGSSITSDDKNAVTASALPGATNGISKITVTQIAKPARIEGGSVSGLSLSKKLSDLSVSGNLKITIPSGASTVDVNVDTSKATTVQDLINQVYSTKIPGSDETLYSKIKINFSELKSNLTVESRVTGEKIGSTDNTIALSCTGLENLGLDISPTAKSKATATKGQDAEVTITPPGSTTGVTIKKSSNTFTIDNVTYNLIKDPGNKGAAGHTPYDVTLNTSADAQKSFDKIKGFVDKYNTLVKKITDKLSEKKNLSFKPLTDAQKKEMKDDQIKAWEEKAKAGMLKNENDVDSVLRQLRSCFMEGVASAGISLKDIGIETYGGMEAVTKPGQLKIDEAKLKDAIQNRGDQVAKLFTNNVADSEVAADVNAKFQKLYPDTTGMKADKIEAIKLRLTEEAKFPSMGIFRRIESTIKASAVTFDGTLMAKAGYVGSSSESNNMLTKQLQQQDKAISELVKKVAAKQEKYYQMFAKLETAMNKLNSQQNWLAQQMGQ